MRPEGGEGAVGREWVRAHAPHTRVELCPLPYQPLMPCTGACQPSASASMQVLGLVHTRKATPSPRLRTPMPLPLCLTQVVVVLMHAAPQGCSVDAEVVVDGLELGRPIYLLAAFVHRLGDEG